MPMSKKSSTEITNHLEILIRNLNFTDKWMGICTGNVSPLVSLRVVFQEDTILIVSHIIGLCCVPVGIVETVRVAIVCPFKRSLGPLVITTCIPSLLTRGFVRCELNYS